MYIHRTSQSPPQNTPFPGLNLKAGKMNYSLGNLDPNWAKCLKSVQKLLIRLNCELSQNRKSGSTFFPKASCQLGNNHYCVFLDPAKDMPECCPKSLASGQALILQAIVFWKFLLWQRYHFLLWKFGGK